MSHQQRERPTPGPLMIRGPSHVPGQPDKSGDYAIIGEVAGRHMVIGETYQVVGREPDGTYISAPAMANALRFGASPQMLASLLEVQMLLRTTLEYYRGEPWTRRVHEAIEAATGANLTEADLEAMRPTTYRMGRPGRGERR